MLEYYCRVLGEDSWSVVRASSLHDAASKYVSNSSTLIEESLDYYPTVFVKIDASDSKIYKFIVTVEKTYIAKLVKEI